LNVWKDYKETESIRTRPETELDTSFAEKVYGVFFYKGEMLVHSGSKLYNVKDGVVPEKALYSELNETASNSFIYDDVWYFKDGKHYLKYDGTDISRVVDNAYIPTTTIARKPMGGGTKYEDVNMLSDYRKNSFLSDGASFSYFLDVMNIDEEQPEVTVLNKKTYYSVTRNTDDDTYTKTDTKLELEGDVASEMLENESGITTTGEKVYSYDTNLYCCIGYADTVIPKKEYIVDYKEGKIVFKNTPPDEPLTAGRDNVVVKFKKAVPKYHDSIMKCTTLQVFDNRVFFSGNPDHPNMMWNSSLNDPSYVSDLDYYKEGMDSAAIKGMVAGNNALWVFREPSDSNTTIFYHTPTLDEEYGKVYPSSHSSVTTGCIGKAINFNDDIVFFSERGMEGISGDITTEQVVSHRSSLVDSRLISEKDYKNMVLAEWEGYLLVFIGNKVYLADSRAMFQNDNHYEYEFFYWELDHNVICATVNNGVLYLGTDNGIYTLTDTTADVESYWVTPLDKFKYPHRLKTTNKRGCVAEATTGTPENNYVGEISVYAKLEDTDFELIGTYKDVTDYFVSRIKRKKFKDIQLKFHSNTRFSLETVTLECFVGGYIKR
jgi:hypothetical protein